MIRVRVAVLARAAVAGHAKTRLIPALGPQRAARLQAHLTALALRRAVATGAGVTLWITGQIDPATDALTQRLAIEVRRQPEGDLGLRMLEALREADGPALVIGTDCPAQDQGDLERAGMLLADNDVVLQPAHDGGYVLIGMTHPEPRLFSEMPWGSDTICEETRSRASALGLRCAELRPLPDLDRPEDLTLALANGWLDRKWG